MLVVAVNTLVQAASMVKAGGVALALILVATLHFAAVQRGGCREVVDVDEAQFLVDRVGVRVGNRLVDGHSRSAALVTLHTTRRVADPGDLHPAGEDNAGLGERHVVMAGFTFDSRAYRGCRVNRACRRAIHPQEVTVAGG